MDAANRIVRTEWTATGTPSEGVVDAVATAADCDPLDIEPLQRYVDGDALDALVGGAADGSVRVAFEYDQFSVVVESSGTVEVYGD